MKQNIDITQLLELASRQKEAGNSRVGLSFPELLTVSFVTLKFLGYFPYNWFWAFSPIFIIWIFYIVIFIIGFLIAHFNKR